jgi:putative ABC transport system substrate-binding protein
MSSRTLVIAALLVAVAAACPPVDAQQPPKIARIGYLVPASPAAAVHNIEALRQGLREAGYVEGKTFVLEVRYGEARSERFPELARELVGLKVDVIVMVGSSDPVGSGFVASLARPGGNVTGLTNISAELSGKRLELLREVVPGLSRVAFLWNPDVRGNVLDYKEMEGVARSQRLQLQSVEVVRVEDLERAFSAVTSQRAQALILPAGNPVGFANRGLIASFAQRNRLPSMYAVKEYVDAGGLMSYGPSNPDMRRRAATYVDKILKGAKPADLPVQQPTTFELAINLKIAKALGLTMPQSLLRRADQVIQ